jgi:hypothetical protein
VILESVLTVLQWRDGCEESLDVAESSYASLVSAQLGRDLGRLEETDPERAADVLGQLSAADADALRRVVLAPETCSRLLWGHPGRCDDRDFWQYLTDELATGAPPTTLAGLHADTDSPAAICFDYSTLLEGGMRLEHYRDAAAKEVALRKLEEAMRSIGDLDATLAAFVRRFTLVAHAVVDIESSKFTSGSTGQYIGRSIFCNAHLPSADVELLAESLVHEATHSLLYMHEAVEPWVLREKPFDAEAIVVSPWSGATLPVRPFLQACFVWFGLVNFWSLAQGGSTFRSLRLEERLDLARRGFLAGPLLERIPQYVPHLAPELVELLRAMQEKVIAGARQQAVARR